jgi:putative transposase
MSYSKQFCHLVWGTKEREPYITAEVEALLRRSFGRICRDNGVTLLAAGMMPDHVHVVLRHLARHSASELARFLKGSSSHLVKRVPTGGSSLYVAWQREFGAISVDEDSLERAIAYVKNQKQHHSSGTLIEAFETLEKPYARTPSAGGAS